MLRNVLVVQPASCSGRGIVGIRAPRTTFSKSGPCTALSSKVICCDDGHWTIVNGQQGKLEGSKTTGWEGWAHPILLSPSPKLSTSPRPGARWHVAGTPGSTSDPAAPWGQVSLPLPWPRRCRPQACVMHGRAHSQEGGVTPRGKPQAAGKEPAGGLALHHLSCGQSTTSLQVPVESGIMAPAVPSTTQG